MNRVSRHLIRTGIAASGLASFFYAAGITSAVLAAGKAFFAYQLRINLYESIMLIAAFVLFEAFFALYITRIMKTRIKELTRIRRPGLSFLSDTLVLTGLTAVIFAILRLDSVNIIVRSAAVISLVFIAGIFFQSAVRIITYFLMVKILCAKTGEIACLDSPGTVPLSRLYASAEAICSHSIRFGIPMAFIGVRMIFPDPPEGPSHRE
ncbi:MAG: hypothetical protein ACRCUT_04250, partial [Spirochaetota bacterium]